MQVEVSASFVACARVRPKRLFSSFLTASLLLSSLVQCLGGAAPGPDGFGYTVASTSAFSFTNIANNPTVKRALVLADDEAVTANLGFTFNFYGSNYTTVSFSENGLMTFGGVNINPTNQNLMTNALVPDLPSIAVFWDDWETLTEGRPVFYDTIGTVGNRQFIVQWERLVATDELSGFDWVTFQARLFETNNFILFSYLDVVLSDDAAYGRGARQTVGIRDRAGHSNNRNLQWSHNQVSLTNGQNLLFSRANIPPVAGNDSLSTLQNQPAIVHVLANDRDADGHPLTITAITQGTNGTVTLTSTNTLRYAPALNYSGPDHFTYTISDGRGGSATGSVSVAVVRLNTAPTARADAYRINEDHTLVVPAPGVLSNDTDAEGGLSAVVVTPPARGTLHLALDGSFTFLPPTNYHGTETFVYQATDGSLSSNATVTITIDPINDPPVALSASLTTTEDTPIDVLLRGIDADDDPLGYTLLSHPHNGTLSGAVPNLVYTPVSNFHGADAFTFAVSDGHGPSATGTVFITVTSVNEFPPVAGNDRFQAFRNRTLTLDADELLANDSDADVYDRLVITSVSSPSAQGGTVTLDLDNVTYVPATGFVGSDSFTYVVSDGQGSTATATVQISVSLWMKITNIAIAPANAVVVTFEADAGGVYRLEASSNLVEWASIGTATETSPGIYEITELDGASGEKRLYRIATEP